jgi:hypothetical protein
MPFIAVMDGADNKMNEISKVIAERQTSMHHKKCNPWACSFFIKLPHLPEFATL